MRKIKLMMLFALLQIAGIISVSADVFKGNCGTNVTFTLNTETGLLEIEGEGSVSVGYETAPWSNQRDYVKSVKISDRVKSIGPRIFEGCGNLKAIEIPDSVKYIGEYAFQNCSRLASVKLPAQLQSIGNYAFDGCDRLTSIVIPDGMQKIDEDAFYGCSRLSSVTIPSSVETIERYAFANCARLASITIPEGVYKIGQYAFRGCSRLASIELPTTLEEIGGSAFSGCEMLADVTIPDGMWTIGAGAFADCTGLESITLPATLETIEEEAFRGCGKLAAIDIPKGVIDIKKGAFQNCTSLTSFTIPNGITAVAQNLFNGCTNLEEVNIPKSVTGINSDAFAYCDSLKSVTLTGKFSVIGDAAFRNCRGLKAFTVPQNVSTIGNRAFEGCSNLESITIPSTVNTINEYAFRNCESLTSFTIPEKVTTINERTFEGCTKLAEVNIPQNVTYIDYYAFAYCDSLKSVTLPGKIEKLDGFSYSGLTSVNIPASVKTIEQHAFEGCANLKSVNIPNSVTSIGYEAFRGCTSLESLYIPDSRKPLSISSYAFTNCKELTSVVIPNNVSSISDNTFEGCARLKTVSLSGNTTSIQSCAFAKCDSITNIFLYGEKVKSGYTDNSNYLPFSNVAFQYAILHVPASQLEAYKTTAPWSSFSNIVAIKEEEKPAEDNPTNYVFVEECKATAGKDITVPLLMNNKVKVTGFQCDVYLPEGVTFAKDDEGLEKIALSTKRTSSKETDYFSYRMQETGAMRILCSSTTSKTFSGNEGEVATMVLHVDKDATPGLYPVVLKNIVLSDSLAQTYRNNEMKAVLTVVDYEFGDANNDKEINVGDYTAIANYIQGVTADDFVADAADVNRDGLIDVGDLTGVANIILSASITETESKVRSAAGVQALANDLADYDNAVYPTDAKVQADGTATISVCMKNVVEVTGYQFDMYLPEGFTYATDEEGYELIELSTKRTTKRNTDFFSYRMQTNGAMRVLCSSTTVKTFKGNDGEVCTVVVKAPEGVKEGSYPVILKNIVMSDPKAKTYKADKLAANIIVDSATGINTVAVDSLKDCRIFSVDGKERQTLGSGVNIIRTADGKTVKVIR